MSPIQLGQRTMKKSVKEQKQHTNKQQKSGSTAQAPNLSCGHKELEGSCWLQPLYNCIYWLQRGGNTFLCLTLTFPTCLNYLMLQKHFGIKYNYRKHLQRKAKTSRRKSVILHSRQYKWKAVNSYKGPHLRIKKKPGKKSYTFITPHNKKQTGCDQEAPDWIANRWRRLLCSLRISVLKF